MVVARKPRAEAPGAIHHVVCQGVAGQEIVRDDVDRRAFIARLARTVELHRWSCLAFCLLDNHFHLVVETPLPNLSVGMKWLKASYAQDFNYRHRRRGPVFGGRFYSQLIERDSHLVAAIIYVFLNPVRAGLVERGEEWSWSSYAATIGVTPAPAFLHAHRVLSLVDERRDVAMRRLATAVVETTKAERTPGGTGVRPVGSDPGKSTRL